MSHRFLPLTHRPTTDALIPRCGIQAGTVSTALAVAHSVCALFTKHLSAKTPTDTDTDTPGIGTES